MTEKDKIYIALVVVAIFLGLLALVWALCGLVLSRFKSDKIKGFKYDIKVTLCMLLFIDSYYIKFFSMQFTTYRLTEFIGIIPYVFIIGLLPFNFINTLICGVKGKWIPIITLSYSFLSGLLFVFSSNIL